MRYMTATELFEFYAMGVPSLTSSAFGSLWGSPTALTTPPLYFIIDYFDSRGPSFHRLHLTNFTWSFYILIFSLLTECMFKFNICILAISVF